MRAFTRFILLSGFVSGCASAPSTAVPELVRRGIAGVWVTEDSRMEIACDGTFYYSGPDDPRSLQISRPESGRKIDGIYDRGFDVNTALPWQKQHYAVEAWPAQSGDAWVMKVNDELWKRESGPDPTECVGANSAR